MNQKTLRAGKAVDETEPSPLAPGNSPEKPKIPPLLFEGDESPKPAQSTQIPKFDLGATPQTEPPKQEAAKLPEAYGTEKLLVTARDPHALFAHWDLTKEQQQNYNSLSADGHLTLRAYAHAHSNQPAVEAPIQPDSRHMFLNVERAGTSYVGELGYYKGDGNWKTVATSAPASTPPDAPSTDSHVVFSKARRTIQATAKPPTQSPGPAIIPVTAPRWPFEPQDPEESEPLAEDTSPSPDDTPLFVRRGPVKKWSSLQEHLLSEMIRVSFERREWISSAEIAEVIQREIAPPSPWPVLPEARVNISSPTGEEHAGRKGFWFNVNAELIVYGATEPNAQVTIGGRLIKLRPDGTFACHFALPDGNFALTATAISPENEQRQAAMNFSRQTDYSGGAESPRAGSTAHPQNPSLERLPQSE